MKCGMPGSILPGARKGLGEPGGRGVTLTKVRVYDILIAQLNVIVNCISFANKKRRWWPPFFVWELLLVLSIQPFAYVICNNTSKNRQKECYS